MTDLIKRPDIITSFYTTKKRVKTAVPKSQQTSFRNEILPESPKVAKNESRRSSQQGLCLEP